jgi:ferredoxin
MATLLERLASNAAGRFYVDASCIDCDICRSTAPEFFRRNDELGFSEVYRQPIAPVEIAQAEEALDGCPTGSIGGDGC